MNKPASSLTEQDFVRLPADRSMADAIVRPSVSYWRDVLRRIRSDKVAIVSLTFLVIIILMAIFAPILSPYGYETTDLLHTNQPPSAEHWFGTDAGGRDLWTRVWVGARISLIIGLGGAIVPQIIGIFLGGLSGLGKLFAYIAGKIFICRDIVWNGILRKIRNLEDNTTEFRGQIGGRLSRQLGHIIHIYTGVLCNGYGQSFRCGIYRGDSAGLTDGALCKHICFPKKLVVLI